MDECLCAEDIRFSYGKREVLHGLSAAVRRGAYTSVIGPNGSGKSTLFRLLCGARPCASGRVLFEGRDVRQLAALERARLFSVVRQGEKADFPFTCLEMVLMGLHPFLSRFGEPSPEQMAHILRVMEDTGTLGFADQPVTQVSGGEFQRVVLARALAQRPRVLFLDEAMSDLDIAARIRMTEYLRGLCAAEGLTVVTVSHDLQAAFQYSDRVLALREGTVAASGTPEEVMTPAFFAAVFGVQAEMVPGKGFFIRGLDDEMR